MSRRQRREAEKQSETVSEDAEWTVGLEATGFIDFNGTKMAYWTKDGNPLPQHVRVLDDSEIPF